MFRGALGTLMPRTRAAGLPRGFAEPPRPFVLRAAHLDGLRIEPGGEFGLEVNVFDLEGGTMRALAEALGELKRTGLGPRRAKVELLPPAKPRDIELDLAPGCAATKVTVRFVTPTDLKGLPPRAGTVPFGILFARARDRVSSLLTLYGEGPLEIDFAGMAERAAGVRTVSCELIWRHITRRSSRTGQTHGIGGFTGKAEYEGDLTGFLPYLRAAWWTGIGRHTAWGNGVIACE